MVLLAVAMALMVPGVLTVPVVLMALVLQKARKQGMRFDTSED